MGDPRPTVELGELQLAVMDVVWEHGSATVSEVHESLQDSRRVAYTTVLSTLRALDRRGLLRHEKEGKAHRFFPLVTREQFTDRSVRSLVERLFRGRPEALMSHLMGSEQLTSNDLDRIRELIDEEGS